MEEHSQSKFLNQFIQMIRQDVKKVGIITDKDGTILLDDSLRQVLKDFKEKHLGVKIYLIANSGRTIQDMINCLEKENIPPNYFDYIIGDNGDTFKACSIAFLSYVCPSDIITGSFIIAKVIGHKNSLGTSAILLFIINYKSHLNSNYHYNFFISF